MVSAYMFLCHCKLSSQPYTRTVLYLTTFVRYLVSLMMTLDK
jgi:hypothetical protein